MRAKFPLLILACFVFLTNVAFAADSPEVTGKIDAVTVYRGQALITRLLDVQGPAGLREVVVTNLPEQVVPGSIFAEAGDGVEVRSVRFRTRAVAQDVREDVRKLEAQIRDTSDAIAANTRSKELNAERKAYLDKLQDFVAPTASAELTKGVLNAETLKTITSFSFDQRQQLAVDDLKIAKTARDLAEQLDLLQRQMNELTAGASKTVREAVVFANFKNATGGQLRLKYLVNSASWSPSYVARAADGKANRAVRVQYNASIQQMSGEDWSDVTMTLSTATPSMVATAPQLDPLEIVLASGRGGDESINGAYAAQKGAISEQRKQLEMSRNAGFGSFGATANQSSNASMVPQAQGQSSLTTEQQDSNLNDLAGKLQVLELVARDAGNRGEKDRSATDQQGISVTYQLPARTSLPSREDEQIIQIATLEMTGDFYKLAMPVLTSYVYDQATVTNDSRLVLLAGNVASYFNDQFVGAGSLPTVSVGEQFTLGFGIDSSLRANRELVDKTESIQGGNRVMNFNYRLSVENFGSSSATVRLVDRLPTSKNQDIKFTIESKSREPSTQPVGPSAAGSAARHAGILNWTLDVPAQAMGEKAATVDYQYKLEFDKMLSIGGLPLNK
jgi:hypothetical protein